MGLSHRKFKLAAVRRLEAGVAMAEVARGLEVNPSVLHRWQREFRQAPGQRLSLSRAAVLVRVPDREFEREIGRQAVVIDFLKGCLQRIEEQRMLQASTGNLQSAARSRKK